MEVNVCFELAPTSDLGKEPSQNKWKIRDPRLKFSGAGEMQPESTQDPFQSGNF